MTWTQNAENTYTVETQYCIFVFCILSWGVQTFAAAFWCEIWTFSSTFLAKRYATEAFVLSLNCKKKKRKEKKRENPTDFLNSPEFNEEPSLCWSFWSFWSFGKTSLRRAMWKSLEQIQSYLHECWNNSNKIRHSCRRCVYLLIYLSIQSEFDVQDDFAQEKFHDSDLGLELKMFKPALD